MKLTIEMHHPHHPEVPVWKEYIDIMRGEGKGVLGFVPDMSIFSNHPHELWVKEALDAGCRKDVLESMIDKHSRKLPDEEILAGDLTEIEKFYGEQMIESYNAPAKLEQLRDLIDCAFYMHGKFYYINDQLQDVSIPYEQILPMIQGTDYDGYIVCEYEGHHFDTTISAVEQLNRYVAMSNRILGRN